MVNYLCHLKSKNIFIMGHKKIKTESELLELRNKMLQEFELKNELKYLHILGNEFYDDCVYISSIEDDHDIKGASNLDWVSCSELNKKFIDYQLRTVDYDTTRMVLQIIGLFLHKNNFKEKVFLLEDDVDNFKYYYYPRKNQKINDFICSIVETIIVTEEQKTGMFSIDKYLEIDS